MPGSCGSGSSARSRLSCQPHGAAPDHAAAVQCRVVRFPWACPSDACRLQAVAHVASLMCGPAPDGFALRSPPNRGASDLRSPSFP